ncbi:PepSY-associated TM helix domain-containing protein [Chitinophaga sp. Ak27]|uniref:PepSY-associated TM helix domain-containing protein n=1 Tax=Chitinophaga sp. Ak27 TaxID=2726116 RepID=UPI00145D1C26|nr:PepSY-associated TM helix domain-containing protein [Chitinophaga sp. Ak27]NLU96340.1 PepSY domain-containing protein [Chitinophaga sp. Ak27]
MKIFFRRIHLYLGLTAGLVITISCLTGALLVFEKELTEAFNHDRYYVTPAGERLSLDKVAALVKEQVPGAGISRMQIFADPARTIQVTLEEGRKGSKKEAAGEKKGPKENTSPMGNGEKAPKKGKGRIAFVNPYTGEIVELYSYSKTFYYKVFSLHRWLLAGDTGKAITGASTLIFVFILITGIILWWPKTRNIFKQRIKVKWDGGWKRLNHDLHIVLGFYAAIFLFVSAFTGLTWSYEWFSNGLYAVLHTSPKPVAAPSSAPAEIINSKSITFEAALASVQQTAPGAVFYALSAPKDSTAAFMVSLLPAHTLNEAATTTYYLDQFNGKVLKSETFAQRNLGQKVRSTIKPLHTGAIFGTASKIFALIIALLGVTFPTTGTIMWINRTRKKKKSVKAPVRAREAEPAPAA